MLAEALIPAERAAALAREGRLKITVLVADEALFAERLAVLTRLSQRIDDGWHVVGEAPARLASAVTEPPQVILPALPNAPGGSPPVLVASHGLDGQVRLTTESNRRDPELVRRVVSVQLLGVEARPRTLVSVLKELSELTPGVGDVVFIEAMDVPLPADPVLDPEAVLWWGQPPEGWVSHVRVPVVVETIERE
jgi:hypothetical protein